MLRWAREREPTIIVKIAGRTGIRRPSITRIRDVRSRPELCESIRYHALSGCRPTAKWQYRQKLRQILRQIVRRKGSENASSLRAILLIAKVLQAVHVAS
jgi:hypothetical protein